MTSTAGSHPAAADAARQKYLVFRLANEEYGIDILKVQEIRSCERVTRIPNVPEFITGVTNLRGVIVPIIDLRVRFDIALDEENSAAVVIVLNLKDRVLGIMVDGVADVLSLNDSQIKATPDVSSVMASNYLEGIGVMDKRMVILVNIEKLLSREEMQVVGSLAEAMVE